MKHLLRILSIGIVVLAVLVVSAQDDDLRVVRFDFFEDFYAEVEVRIEPGDVSILFNVTTSDPEDYVYMVEVLDGDGVPIYDIEDEFSPLAFGFEPLTEDPTGQLGVFLPASPDYALEPGDYLFVFEAEMSTITDVSAIIRSGNVDGPQALDFNLWGLTDALSDSAAQSEFASVMRNTMDAVLNPHNLQVGDIAFFEASDADYGEFAYPVITDDDARSLEAICEAMSATVGATRAMNVAIVEGFDESTSEEGGTAGIAISAGNAGIILEGSPFSCVVVSYEAYGDDYANQAVNILHEGGHFMSLPHTTESDGEWFDIFDDTPECAAEDFDMDGDGYVDDFECDIEGGANNLMFWSGEPDYAPFILSNDQAWVLRRHPLFYPVGN